MKKRRITAICITAMVAVLGFSMTSYAAGWQQSAAGWRWQNDDNTWPVNSWQWLDGNGDGIAECYYFDASGYMLSSTMTPDGYQVDQDGHWIVNGVIQTKAVGQPSGSSPSGGGGGATHSTTSGNNPYAGNRTVTGRYDLTSAGKPLQGVYDVPIDKTDVTAINDPQKFCELMNSCVNINDASNPGDKWRFDPEKPVVESGQSNIYYYYNSLTGDSRAYPKGFYKIAKVSTSRPIHGDPDEIYEIRVYGFENGYLLVNTIRNGIYFNERGEAVIDGIVVRHTNCCYYGGEHWDTSLAQKREFEWDYDPLTWEGYPIIYHNKYRKGDRGEEANLSGALTRGYGFGNCCADIYNFN